MEHYAVYMLRCADDSLYTGITNDIEKRLSEHSDGIDRRAYTFKSRPVVLVYRADFHEVTDAIDWEKRIKRWSRKKKEALIKREYEKLPELSKRQTPFKNSKITKCHPEEERSDVSKGDTSL